MGAACESGEWSGGSLAKAYWLGTVGKSQLLNPRIQERCLLGQKKCKQTVIYLLDTQNMIMSALKWLYRLPSGG